VICLAASIAERAVTAEIRISLAFASAAGDYTTFAPFNAARS